MSDNTTIEWADTTWGPVLGCDRVSPGCDNCYAITQAHIRAANPHPRVAAAFAGLTERTDHGVDWTGRINLLDERLRQPFTWRKPRKVFVNSLADLFHKDVPDEFIAKVFAVMAATPQHTYQILTKRHGRMRSLLSAPEFVELFQDSLDAVINDYERDFVPQWPLPNVWLGVSVEDQKRADLRIPALLDTPAAVRWISAEPLLGPIDLHGPLDQHGHRPRLTYWLDGRPGWGAEETTATGLIMQPLTVGPRLDWVVVGGESGPGARPMHPDWARTLRDQCISSDVAFLFKQWGSWRPGGDTARPADWINPDGTISPWRGPGTDQVAMVKVGKKAAGRVLDGWTWDQYPDTRTAVA